MAIQTTTFKGARYLVKYHDPIDWSESESYEAIEAVKYGAYTYISKQPVPAGVSISNTDFWLLWADPNAQMEELRRLVSQYAESVEVLSDEVDGWGTRLAAEVDGWGTRLAAEVENRENADAELRYSIKNSTSVEEVYLSESAITLLGTLSTSETSTHQGMTKLGEYLYVVYFPKNTGQNANSFLGKYKLDDLTLESNYAFDYHNHGNSVNVDPINNEIICTPSRTARIDFVDPDTMELHKTVAIGVNIASYCANRTHTLIRTNGVFFAGPIISKVGVIIGSSESPAIGSANGFGDMCQLYDNQNFACISNVLGGLNYGRNAIILLNNFGKHIGTINLPNIENHELEGITLDSENQRFIINDANGNVYSVDVSSIWRMINPLGDISNSANILMNGWCAPTRSLDNFPMWYTTLTSGHKVLTRFYLPNYICNQQSNIFTINSSQEDNAIGRIKRADNGVYYFRSNYIQFISSRLIKVNITYRMNNNIFALVGINIYEFTTNGINLLFNKQWSSATAPEDFVSDLDEIETALPNLFNTQDYTHTAYGPCSYGNGNSSYDFYNIDLS